MKIILTFDIGTTSTKCCAFDEAFHMVASCISEYGLDTGKQGQVSVDPIKYWDALCKSTKEIFLSGVEPKQVACVAITTQGETLIPLDDAGNPVLPAIVWLDDRAEEEAGELKRKINEKNFYCSTGLPEITGTLPLAKVKWILKRNPSVKQILLLEDYMIYLLSGIIASESSLLCSTGYFDINTHTYQRDFLEMAGADISQFPPVCEPGTVVGGVTAEAAKATGIPAGTPVICTAMDQVCSAIGAGNILPGKITETTGTCLTVCTTAEKPDYEKLFPLQIYTHYNEQYLVLSYNPTAAMDMKWLKEQVIGGLSEIKDKACNPYQYMGERAAQIAPGSDGLMLLPHFAGENMPEFVPEMRGIFAGISLGTTKWHFVRAVMEGVSYMLRENIEQFQKAGLEVSEIVSLGGGAKDPLWCQIKADVLNCRLTTLANAESTSVGAAILARNAIDPKETVEELCSKATAAGRIYEKDEELVKLYQQEYKKYLLLNELGKKYYAGSKELSAAERK